MASPHKVYGPEANDLILQLRKRRIERVVLAGMSANLCVEAHLRELLEQGFEVSLYGQRGFEHGRGHGSYEGTQACRTAKRWLVVPDQRLSLVFAGVLSSL